MNDFTVFLYFLCFAAVAGATFAYMWRLMGSTLDDFNNMDRPIKSKNVVHPEMEDVKSGEQLLFFKSNPEDGEDDDGEVIIVRK
tara:strand:- start:75 stop:326 length:252 start_codon:yes stop_codon:yes gene_type:complete